MTFKIVDVSTSHQLTGQNLETKASMTYPFMNSVDINYVFCLWKAPGASIPCYFARHGCAYCVLLPHDCFIRPGDQLSHTMSLLPKPLELNQVAIAAIEIFSNTYHIWTMYLGKDSISFILEAPGAKMLIMEPFCDNLQTFSVCVWGEGIQLGRALHIVALLYLNNASPDLKLKRVWKRSDAFHC